MDDYVPLFQTLSWILFIGVLLLIFKGKVEPLFDAVAYRLRHSRIKGRGFEIGEDLRRLPDVASPAGSGAGSPGAQLGVGVIGEDVLASTRESIYRDTRGVFLAHSLQPSQRPGQEFDIFIYLIRHRSTDFSDVSRADFFLGKHWGNKVFQVHPTSREPIGIRASAFGTFLCICRVTFTDGDEAILHRYIDFEMGRALEGA